MNFVTRGVNAPIGPAADRTRHRPNRKWLVSYRAIEPLAIASDVIAVFLSSVLTGVIYSLEMNGTPGDVIQYFASAAAVSALFLSLTIGRSLYDPAELLDVKTQIRATAA